MANVRYNPSTQLFTVENERVRPPWDNHLKQWLLQDFRESNWSKQTTVAELLQHHQPIDFNNRGVIETLERRHIVSWYNITRIYEGYMNVITNYNGIRLTNTLVESYILVVNWLLTHDFADRFNYSRNQIAHVNAFVDLFNQALPLLNSSTNNVFIGPMRANRSIGEDYDTALTDNSIPEELRKGRGFRIIYYHLGIIHGGANPSEGRPEITL